MGTLRQSSLLIQVDSDNEIGTDSHLVSRTNSSIEKLKTESSSQSDRESFSQNVWLCGLGETRNFWPLVWKEKLRMQKISSFSSDFQTLIKQYFLLNFLYELLMVCEL